MQARFEHFAGDGRRGGSAGAVFDEQHADDDARVKRRRERREPGVGVARFVGRPLAACRARFRGARFASRPLPARGVQARLQFRGAGLAGDRRPRGSPRRCRCRRARRRSSGGAPCARRRRSSPARPRRRGAPGVNVGVGPAPAVGDRRRDGRHLERAGQHLTLADRRRADVEFALDLRGRAAACSRRRPRSPVRWLKPKRSAVATRRARAELDAERREHRVAGHREGQFERAAAFLAVGVVQLDPVERGVGRVREDAVRVGDAAPASTPVTVTILKVDPGGCRLSRPMPATARICPVEGASRRSRRLAAERGHRGALHRGGDRAANGRRAGAGRDATRARACPREQLAARGSRAGGRRAPARGRSRPTIASAGTPSASSACAPRGGDRADRAEHRARQFPERRAAIEPARAALPPRLPAGLSASTLPSRASSVARRGSVVRRLSSSPGRSPGKASERDQAMRAPSPPVRRPSARRRARACRTGGCARAREPRRAPPGASRGLPGDAQARGGGGGAGPCGRRRRSSLSEVALPRGGVDVGVHRRRSRPCVQARTKLAASACAEEEVVARADDRADRKRHARQRDHRARAAQALAA